MSLLNEKKFTEILLKKLQEKLSNYEGLSYESSENVFFSLI